MTLATFLLLCAALDFALALVVAMVLARRQAEMPVDRRTPLPQYVIAAGFIGSILLAVLAFSLPNTDLKIL